jgi:hypothetical protein
VGFQFYLSQTAPKVHLQNKLMVVHPDGIQSFFACKMTSGPIPSPDNTAILNSWELLLVY